MAIKTNTRDYIRESASMSKPYRVTLYATGYGAVPAREQIHHALRGAVAAGYIDGFSDAEPVMSDARARALQDAIEGECNGLAIDLVQARAILDHIEGVQPLAKVGERG